MDLVGRTLGLYKILERIGRSGAAELYKAYCPTIDRYVTVKAVRVSLPEDEIPLVRLKREARVLAELNHSNIVRVFDFGAEGEFTYLVMEFLQGPSLEKRLEELQAEGKRLTLEEAMHIVRGVGEALDHTHHYGVVHRDVNPANIMLASDGTAILTNFGSVQMSGSTGAAQFIASGTMIGTPAYTAPEQGMGAAVDGRADVYSLGVVLYRLLTGRLPYDADTPEAIVFEHLDTPLPMPSTLNPDLPEEIERVIVKALAKNPADRYQSMRKMLDHLEQALRQDLSLIRSFLRGAGKLFPRR